jgi:hypothetical protein
MDMWASSIDERADSYARSILKMVEMKDIIIRTPIAIVPDEAMATHTQKMEKRANSLLLENGSPERKVLIAKYQELGIQNDSIVPMLRGLMPDGIERTAHHHQWLEIHVWDMPAYWNRCGRLPKGIAKHLIQLRVTAHLKTGLLT